MKRYALLLPLILIITGCATPSVPQSSIGTPFGPITFPKDMDLEIQDLKFSKDTNGVITLSAKTFRSRSRNNPEAIAAGTAQIDAHYEGASKVIEKGIDAGVKAAAKSAVP